MDKCRVCGCTEEKPVDRTAFFVNKSRNLCASCAMGNKIVFENKITGVNAIIIAYRGTPNPYSKQEVRIKYGREKTLELTLMDFLSYYTELNPHIGKDDRHAGYQ